MALHKNSPLRFSSMISLDGFKFWQPVSLPKFIERDTDILYDFVDGDTVWKLAYDRYGDTRLFWVILWANDIDLPEVDLYPGRTIRIPTRKRVLEELIKGG